MNLESALREHWPPQNVIVECGICGEEIHNTREESHPHVQPPELSSTIRLKASKHKNSTDHNDVNVRIIEKPEMKQEIDVTINVEETV